MAVLRKAAVCAACMLMLSVSGCGKEAPARPRTSDTPEEQTTALTSEATTATVSEMQTETTEATESQTTTAEPVTTAPQTRPGNPAEKDFTRSDEYNELLSETVFVGDSICSGLKVYRALPDDSVVAKGSIGARSILDADFDFRGAKVSLTYALTALNPKYVVFSMGMNDVRLTTEEQFCENYRKLFETVQNALPGAKLFAASVTPIAADSDFTENTHIDAYNAALKEYLRSSGEDWGYLDITVYLKNSQNALDPEYGGTDGIHLKPKAYQAILYAVCEQMTDAGYGG